MALDPKLTERIAESLREAYDLGCNVLHLHFRSRDRDEYADQLAAFGRDVAPLLARRQLHFKLSQNDSVSFDSRANSSWYQATVRLTASLKLTDGR